MRTESRAPRAGQQVGRHVGHEIRGGQPGALVGAEAERSLCKIEIHGDERIAQPAGDPNERADREIRRAAGCGMVRIGTRPRQRGPLMRLKT